MYLWIIGIAVAAYALYKYITRNFDYFEKIGLKYIKPFSNLSWLFSKDSSLGDMINDIYNKFPDEKIIGVFDFSKPIYLIRDPELIKKLAVKDFDHFQDHQNVIDVEVDPLLGNVLTMLKGQKWKDMRSTLSPAFTGKKMRLMFDLVTDCSDQVSKHFLKKTTDGVELILDMKDVFSKFTTDVIATCSFGIQVDSFQHPDNEFFTMGKSVSNFTKSTAFIKFLMFRLMPKVANKLKLRLLGSKITTFFNSLILDTMRLREAQDIVRPDMINLIMQVRKGGLKKENENDEEVIDGYATVTEYNIGKAESIWSDNELVAQCLMFFLAGFETSSTLLSFLTNELALNPDIQRKLCDDIDQVSDNLQGKKLSYEVLQSMKYLDAVISETLRKWPPAILTDRLCNKDYSLEYDDKKITIKKGQLIWIPILGLHTNPDHFPNPEKFDPSRYNEDNVGSIIPGTYIPFGIGPRNCIGSRFALMQIKSILFYMLKEFTFEICEKTTVPIKMGKLTLLPKTGIHLGLRKRSHKM